VEIREAAHAEMVEVGDIRIAAYQGGGFISPDSGYAPTLRGLGAEGDGEVFVATAPASGQAERIIGTIMLQTWPHAGEVVTGPHEAEIRALAVRPELQGQGVGRKLLRHTLGRASELGISHLVLCTTPQMRTAHRLYEQEGFVRLPERDWSPAPGEPLLVYGLRLDGRPHSAPQDSAPAG
jgi:ribosomal protein S18 acetylase RimI-like enzyme